MDHLPYIIFVFAVGACVGSFLNVVVYRLPRGESLVTPPSHCPNCNRRLKWYDNIPIFGWIKLGGRCRFCNQPFSVRYPIVEAVTGSIFAFYYIAFYVLQWRSCCPQPPPPMSLFDASGQPLHAATGHWVLGDSWPLYALYMLMLSGLLAASLIDAELFIIPIQIPWIIAVLAFVIHAIADRPSIPGSLNLVGEFGPPLVAVAMGATVGVGISMLLWFFDIMPTSFPQGEPLLEIDRKNIEAELAEARRSGEEVDDTPLPPPYTPKQIRAEIGKEIMFLLPPMLLSGLAVYLATMVPAVRSQLQHLESYDWLTGLMGSLLGASVGGFVVWITRILGTLGFRRVAMGLGDVHLMVGVGAVIGGAGATVAFFTAPFFGILIAIYMLITRKGREMPLGPYLSLATAAVVLFYCPIAAWFTPGLQGLAIFISSFFTRS